MRVCTTAHSARRRFRAREVEEQDKHEALRPQKAPPPGKRPRVLKDPEPQGRMGQHCGVGYELVQALARPSAADGGTGTWKCSVFSAVLCLRVAEQVYRSAHAASSCMCCSACGSPRTAGWWNSWWKCRPCYLLPCSSSRLSCRPLTFQFLIVVVVVLQGSLPELSPTASGVEQIVDISSGGQQRFVTSVRAQQPHPLPLRMRLLQGVFALLPVGKKRCAGRRESQCEGAPARQPMDSGG